MSAHSPHADTPLPHGGPASEPPPVAPTPAEPSLAQRFMGEDWSPRAWLALVRDLYLSFDRRTLGFARIFLGFLLALDVIHRGAAWSDMYSDDGVLPTWLDLQRPSMWGTFSIFHGFSTPGEVRILWALMLANALCLMVGYKTKVAQILALVFQTGLNTRISMIENGGYVVNNLLVLWTCFLPLGDRFSLDALLASLKRRRETSAAELNDRAGLVPADKLAPFVSVIGLVLMLQIAAIYYFNVIHKTGPSWRDGTAVHYVLYNDRMATPIVALIRDHIPNFLIIFMTKSAMTCEALIPVALLQPLARPWARRVVIVAMCSIHIAFGTTFTLGPFSWSCCVFATLLFTPQDWEIASSTMRRAGRARVVAFDPRSGGALFVCRLLARLDRFQLLTFVVEEGLPLGLAVCAPPAGLAGAPSDPARWGLTMGRAEGLADVVAALPLGPALAWILRLPGVRSLVDAALGAMERRDVSGFFGLRVPAAAAPVEEPAAEPTPRVPAWMVIVSTIIVAGAVVAALKIDQPFTSVALVVAVASVTLAVDATLLLPTFTFARVRRTVVFGLRELLVLAMFAAAVDQAMVELWCIKNLIKVPQPEPLATMAHKLRFLQGWFMFSPNPVMDDGTIVVDAVTADGRHIDPFMGGKPPNFDLLSAKSLWLSQIWGDYFNRMKDPGTSGYRDAMRDYIYRYPDRTGRPEDAIVSGEVYWVHDLNPKWNSTQSYGLEKQKLFGFEKPAAPQPPQAPAVPTRDGKAPIMLGSSPR
jgi:Vitamin K-dependent gamma-carboxylase